jgi:hydroxyethylthiazole kinase
VFEQTHQILTELKKKKPLILNITNYVTMEFVCNGLLSIGASPVVSQAEDEMTDLLRISQAVVINPGTLNNEFISLCKRACEIANELNLPIILDPVGAGASQYRTEFCKSLIQDFRIAIVRGNASEIAALNGSTHKSKGVDSTLSSHAAIESAKYLSTQFDTVITISGEVDILINKDLMTELHRGSSVMPTITGTGCLLTSVIAAFHAIEKNGYEAAKSATYFYGVCGEIAALKSQGPGTFKTHFLDSLSHLPNRGHYESA